MARQAQSKYTYLEPARIASLGNLNLVARQVVEGFISGLHRSPYHGFSVEFAEHREYSPGDSLRHLDWQALGRTDRLYIKQYEEETNLRAYVLLDCSASMGYSSTEAINKFQYACFLASCLAYLMLRQQDSVGLIAFDDRIRVNIPPRSTTSHFDYLMQSLEGLQPGNETRLAETFHTIAEQVRKRALLIVLSDLYDDESQVLKALGHFRHKKHEVLLFHIFDPMERRLSFDRLTDFQDMETNDRIQVDPRQVREEYLRLFDEFVSFYTRAASEHRMDYLVTDTETPYYLMLHDFLARRMRL